MFKVGDVVVYPAHGVGTIEAIEKKKIAEKNQKFYIMKIIGNGMTIMIPIDNVEQVGLREVVSCKDVPKVYKILKKKDPDATNTQTWNRRYREYMEKIKTGSVFEVATVLRDLFLIRVGKDLSFGERRMMDMAKGLLVRELSIAQEMSEDSVQKEIESIFAS